MSPVVLCTLFFLYTTGNSYILVRSTTEGVFPVAGLAAILASPGLMFLAALIEGGWPRVTEVFNWRTQFYSFLFGDWALAIGIAIIAFYWQGLALPSHWLTLSIVLALLGGLAFGIRFHISEWQGTAYSHDPLILASPTKVAHDLGTYTMLTAGLLLIIPPLLSGRFWVCTAFLALVVWGVFILWDKQRNMDYSLVHHPYQYKDSIILWVASLTITITLMLIGALQRSRKKRMK